MKNKLTAEELRNLLSYDPDAGVFTWLVTLRNGTQRGSKAGYPDSLGYIQIGYRRIQYKAHRLAWLYMTGEWPEGDVDHINGEPPDNRWANLRCVSHAENLQNRRKPRANSKSGIMGVYCTKYGFHAQITTDGKLTYLGRYSSAEEAHAVYLDAKRKLHKGNTL